jgi:hypothetical protein
LGVTGTPQSTSPLVRPTFPYAPSFSPPPLPPCVAQAGNLQQAATHVKRFRGVEALVPVLADDREFMRRAEQELATLVETQFRDAIATSDVGAVTRCCQLMNLLGQSEKVCGGTRWRPWPERSQL